MTKAVEVIRDRAITGAALRTRTAGTGGNQNQDQDQAEGEEAGGQTRRARGCARQEAGVEIRQVHRHLLAHARPQAAAQAALNSAPQESGASAAAQGYYDKGRGTREARRQGRQGAARHRHRNAARGHRQGQEGARPRRQGSRGQAGRRQSRARAGQARREGADTAHRAPPPRPPPPRRPSPARPKPRPKASRGRCSIFPTPRSRR